MLSLCELRRAARVLERRLRGARVERWLQSGDRRLAVQLYAREAGAERGTKWRLLLCCEPLSARVSELARMPLAASNPPAFASYLRAHLGGARMLSARILDADRQLALRFEAREGHYDLLLSLLGARANVYLLDADGVVCLGLRPAGETRPELVSGAAWSSPHGGAPPEGEDRWAEVGDEHFLQAIEAHYAALEAQSEESDLARRLRRLLARERKSAGRRLERIEAELAEAEQASVLQRQGELLKSALARVEPGAREIELRDFETGEPVVVPLDPRLSPKANLEATFKRYHKWLRRLTKAGAQLDSARERCAQLEALESELERCLGAGSGVDHEALSSLAEQPEAARLLARDARHKGEAGMKPSRTRPALPARLRGLPRKLLPRRYRSEAGLEIWVGRSDECNDHLTTRLARGNDLFFHLDGAPGSHVILRTGGRSDPPSEALLDACELAVHFSKQKRASRADVHVVPIKQVKKPRGAKPGLVYVSGGRSVHLRRDEKRLARLLAARIED